MAFDLEVGADRLLMDEAGCRLGVVERVLVLDRVGVLDRVRSVRDGCCTLAGVLLLTLGLEEGVVLLLTDGFRVGVVDRVVVLGWGVVVLRDGCLTCGVELLLALRSAAGVLFLLLEEGFWVGALERGVPDLFILWSVRGTELLVAVRLVAVSVFFLLTDGFCPAALEREFVLGRSTTSFLLRVSLDLPSGLTAGAWR